MTDKKTDTGRGRRTEQEHNEAATDIEGEADREGYRKVKRQKSDRCKTKKTSLQSQGHNAADSKAGRNTAEAEKEPKGKLESPGLPREKLATSLILYKRIAERKLTQSQIQDTEGVRRVGHVYIQLAINDFEL